MSAQRYVIATAGHVDHGKSTLVRALTGMEPDRFAEERRRGMTIELGFAWTTLPSGAELAFVDVPGHQRFIATMLAGLGPAPAVLFVVAADEGWSRQSSEHLAAAAALDVRHGLLAITRADRPDADPAAVTADALARLRATPLGEVESVVVSGATGSGLPDLRSALDRLVAALPAPDARAHVRLWLDRRFSVRGSGTVVTGTLAAGTVRVGDVLAIGAREVVVRGLQSAGAGHERLTPVARVALNLRGVSADEVGRGDVLLTPGVFAVTDSVDVRLSSTDAELTRHLVLHVGTAAVPVRVRPLDATHARLALDRALPLRAGDRAVLRDPGRHSVAAGVLVLDADPPPLTRRGAARARATTLGSSRGRPDVRAEVRRRGAVRRDHLERLGVDTSTLDDVAGWLVDDDALLGWTARAPAVLDAWAAGHPLDPPMPVIALARVLDAPEELIATVAAAAGLTLDGGRIRSGAAHDLGPAQQAVDTLVARLRDQPFRAPDADELAGLGLGRRELAAAERAGLLQRLDGIVLLPDAAELALARLRDVPSPFTLSEARQALGTTRRVAVPLLEHLDALGYTRFADDARRALTVPSGDAP